MKERQTLAAVRRHGAAHVSPSTRCSSLTCSHSSPALAWRNHTRSPRRSPVGGRADQRRLHLAGALGADQPQPGRQPRQRQAGRLGRPGGDPAAAEHGGDPRAGPAHHRQREERGRVRPPAPVRVEQRRPVQPGAGGDLGDRGVGGGRGDAAGAAAVDELQVGVLADRRRPPPRRRAAARGTSGAASRRIGAPRSGLPGRRVAEAGDLRLVATSARPAGSPGRRADRGGQRAGLPRRVHRRAAHADVHRPRRAARRRRGRGRRRSAGPLGRAARRRR